MKKYIKFGLQFFLTFFVNPFFSIYIITIFKETYSYKNRLLIFILIISFTLFFFSREYGIQFTEGSDDDIPNYLWMYKSNMYVSFLEIFSRFIQNPGQNEPIWHGFWWFFINFGLSDYYFVFLHCFLNISLVFILLLQISRLGKINLLRLLIVYLFLTPISIESIGFLWRQQIAFSLFMIGCLFYFDNKLKYRGMIILLLSTLIHISTVFYFIFLFFIRSINHFFPVETKLIKTLKCTVYLFIIWLSLIFIINFISSMGLDFVAKYYEGSGFVLSSLITAYIFYSISLYTYIKKQLDKFDSFILQLSLIIFSIPLLFPSASGIYIRLISFVAPVTGLVVFRVFTADLSIKSSNSLISCIYFLGLLRIFLQTNSQVGFFRFLAFGNFFDISMGLFKMILSNFPGNVDLTGI